MEIVMSTVEELSILTVAGKSLTGPICL
jgi:hypothetical protein